MFAARGLRFLAGGERLRRFCRIAVEVCALVTRDIPVLQS
jgi:hypothetical protein